MIHICAELGINHQGNPVTAERMIEAAAHAGCTAVKLQTYRVDDFLPDNHPDRDMFREAEIWPWIDHLAAYAHKHGLECGTTPTSLEGVTEAVDAGIDFLKNGSDFLLRHDLIRAMLDTGLPTWVSTGMATRAEIDRVPDGALLMVCTSLYPCPDRDTNVCRLVNVVYNGFSDHTEGTVAAVLAASFLRYRKPAMIEKHFTLDKTMAGPDHAFSADPEEMTRLVRNVRRAEVLMGSPGQGFTPGEAENRDRWRVTRETLRQ